MQHRQEAKVEYRHRDEYRESFLLRQGLMNASGDAIIAICIIILTLIAIAWLFWNWLITVAFATQPILTIIGVLAILSPIGWKAKVAVDKHNRAMKLQDVQHDLLSAQAQALVINAQRGFNTEITNAISGDTVKVINPVSLQPASKTTNNYYGEEAQKGNTLQIEAPKTVYTLSDQLQSGQTAPDEATSIVGYKDGEPFRAKIFDVQGNLFNSVFVFGDQGFGKSTFGTYLAALTILQGGKLIVIDPESEADQSLTTRLGPLAQEAFLLCPIADTPAKAQTAVNIAKQVIERYGNNKLLVLIDEFTLIARQAAKEDKAWSDVGKEILDMSEEYATRGRKKGCRVVCFGQIPKATRSGNTEVRDSMATVCFNLKKERAQNVLELEDAKQAPSLKQGEIILMPNSTTYRLQLPYPDEKGLEEVVRLGRAMKRPVEPIYAPSEDTPQYNREPNMTGEIVDSTVELEDSEIDLDEPVEPMEESTDTLPHPMMNEIQVLQFKALYPMLGTQEALRQMKCGNRYWTHAKQIIRDYRLERKEA